MEVRAWLIWVQLLEPGCQRSQHAGAIRLSQGGDFPQRQAPPPCKSSKKVQAKPAICLTQSKPGAQARPYSLSLSPDDYHQYLPKPKRLLHATRLMKLSGSSYDPFWMSLEDPRGQNTSQEELGTLNQDLVEHTAQFRKKLLPEAKPLDFSDPLPSKDGIPHNLSQALHPRLHQ